jgi:hypothetical protein
MSSSEWVNLQEALAWVFAPVLNLLLGLFLGGAFVSAVLYMFLRLAKYLTR